MKSRLRIPVRMTIVACLGLAATSALASDCVDYGATLHWAARIGGRQLFAGTLRDGLYYCTGYTTLSIVDVQDPRHPVLLGEIDTSGVGHGVAVSGDFAFVACAVTGFEVFDVANPAAPAKVAVLDVGTGGLDVAVGGHVAYVAEGLDGFGVVDISDPTQPVNLATLDTPGYAKGLALAGDVLYVADAYVDPDTPDILVYDVSDPGAPVLQMSLPVWGGGSDIIVDGNRGYVSSWNYGVIVLDLTYPLSPGVLGFVETTWGTHGLAAAGDLLYAAAAQGLDVIDVGDPLHPFLRAQVRTIDAFHGTSHDVAVINGCAVIANYGALLVVDATYPQEASLAGSYALPDIARGVAVADARLYAAVGRGGLHIAGLADPLVPAPLATLATGDFASGVAVSGPLACVADGDAGLRVIDVSDPANPQTVAAVATPDTAVAVALAGDAATGDLALVADWRAGLQIVDISEPAAAYVVGSLPALTYPSCVAGRGPLAFVGVSSGLAVVDLAEPASPQQIGWVATPATVRGVMLDGDLAYLACYEAGVQVVDISDPAAPHVVAVADTPNQAMASLRVGDDLYVADYSSGMQVRRVTDPLAPLILGSVDTPAGATSLATLGDVLYIADTSSTLQLAWLQCADTVPTLLTFFDATVDGGTVRLAWQLSADVPAADLHLELRADDAVRAVAFTAQGAGAYAAVDTPPAGAPVAYTLRQRLASGGWTTLDSRMVQLAVPQASRVASVQPNPFNPSTTIELQIARTDEVQLAVYDLQGREVAVLARGTMMAGAHRVTWNGRDDGGRAVASGAYVVRLTTSDRVDTRRVMLVQ